MALRHKETFQYILCMFQSVYMMSVNRIVFLCSSCIIMQPLSICVYTEIALPPSHTYALTNLPFSIFSRLECNSQCSIKERNKRLALALEIKNPDLSGKLGNPTYTAFLKDYAKYVCHNESLVNLRYAFMYSCSIFGHLYEPPLHFCTHQHLTLGFMYSCILGFYADKTYCGLLHLYSIIAFMHY